MKFSELRTILFVFVLSSTVLFATACSMPNLENPACTDARSAASRFYGFHFGGDMTFSQENLAAREKYLTPEFYRSLQTRNDAGDVFTTGTADVPKAFRVGECESTAGDQAIVQVLLFWRDSSRSEQRAIHVDMLKRNGEWLIDKILN
ncbi:MAG: hypothetical protein ACR2IH_07015 [Pyrinomonadaceae bacterium]